MTHVIKGYALRKFSRGRLEIRFITKMGTEYLEQLVYIRLGLLIVAPHKVRGILRGAFGCPGETTPGSHLFKKSGAWKFTAVKSP
jgi:hypothetical protein